MTAWVAIAYGALDVRETEDFTAGTELLVVPVVPGDPRALFGEGAALWRRLAETGPVDDADLTETGQTIVREMAELGLASDAADHPARRGTVPRPWLTSPTHELMYALISGVATGIDLPHVFIKGPTLHAQELRDRAHSGDVDVWVQPGREHDLRRALEPWGWYSTGLWRARAVEHSMTLKPQGWGCEIDVHYQFPGITVADHDAFAQLQQHATTMTFAGTTVQVPDRAAHAVIHALHTVRPLPKMPTGEREAGIAAAALAEAGPEALERARGWGAEAALSAPLREAFPDADIPAVDTADAWGWRADPHKRRYYRIALRSMNPAQTVRFMARTLWPPEAEAMMSDSRAGLSSPNAFVARVRRLGRAFNVFRR